MSDFSEAFMVDPAVLSWSQPATPAGGDVVAMARAPGGALLHVLLADGSGADATETSQLLAPFRRMTEKGYGIEAIARELNSIVRRDPASRYVAATLVAVDFSKGLVRVWNGGCPAPVLVGPHHAAIAPGMIGREFSRVQPALGARPDAAMDDMIDVHAFVDGSQLFLCSDGLIEALDTDGKRFGQARFVRVVQEADAPRRFQALHDAVTRHLGLCSGQDHISALMIACSRLATHGHGAYSHSDSGALAAVGEWRLKLRLSAHDVRRVDVVPLLLGMCSSIGCAKENVDQLFIILSELYNNAVDHGLLRMNSALKLDPDGMEVFLAERQSRLLALTEGTVELELEQLAGAQAHWLRVVCRDSGPGFDHAARSAAPNSSDEVLPFGRGLMLLGALCPTFTFNAAGNEATAIFKVDGGDPVGGEKR